MTLKIKSKYDFWTNVTVKSPNEDGGVEQSEIKVQFSYEPATVKHKRTEIMNALPLQQERLSVEFMTESIIGWQGVVDEQGDKIEFNKDVLKQLLEVPWIGSAILEAWSKAINGNPSLGN